MRARPGPILAAILGAALPLSAALLLAPPAASAPVGAQEVLGDVTIEQNADGSLTVIHASDGSIIEYQSFDILVGELVQFIQPGADARVLNRVSGDATHIAGTLEANGIVYIVNPAGVFVDGGAVVDVGGLVAAAGHLSNEDFLAGADRFDLTGPVVNDSDDVSASRVALLGTRVENHGRIEAKDGLIALVAGERVVLYRLGGRVHVKVDGPTGPAQEGVGVVQAGHALAEGGQAILAVGDHYSLAINHTGVTTGGDVLLRGGKGGTLWVQGEIDASDARGEGGRIRVLGDRIALVGARLDASGASGGGRIRIGGGVRGEGRLPTARRTFVDADSELRADATGAGDGGSVVVWGDEAAVMQGAISARGGASGGDGGFAEVSSLGLLDASGPVDLTAPAGRTGTLLLDPQDIVIVGGSADGSDAPDAAVDQLASDDGTPGRILFGDVGDGSEPFEIFESEIEGTNANLVLEARNSVTVSGTFDNQVEGEGTGVVVVLDDNDLTIRTRNDTDDELGSAMTPGIDLGALAWRTGGSGGISIATGDDGAGGGGTGMPADIVVGVLSSEGGSISLTTAAGSITAGDLVTAGADGAAGAGGNGGQVSVSSGDGPVVVGNIDTRGGDGTGAGGAGGAITVVASGSGDVSAGDLDSRGGHGDTDGSGDQEAGGSGGQIAVGAADGDVVVGAVQSSGGDGSTVPDADAMDALGQRGSAGLVEVSAGFGDGGSGDLTLSGPVTAVDGAGAGDAQSDAVVGLFAEGAVEFSAAIVGPHIRTTEEVGLIGDTVGGAETIRIDGVGLSSDPANQNRRLDVDVTTSASVDVTTAGFDFFGVRARSADADVDVTQEAVAGGGDAIDIEVVGTAPTSTLTTADLVDPDVPGGVALQLRLEDELADVDDLPGNLELVVASGAVNGVNNLFLLSEDDIVLQDGAVAMHPTAGDPATRFVSVLADFDQDGTGSIAAGGGGVAIDLNDAAETPPTLFMVAAEGIGAAGTPIRTSDVEEAALGVTTSGGIHLENAGAADLTLRSNVLVSSIDFEPGDAVAVAAGPGDVEISTDGGDLVLDGDVVAAGDMGGGNVTLAVADPMAAIRFQQGGAPALIDAAGDVLLDGPVLLTLDGQVMAGGDATFAGAVDSDIDTLTTRNLAVSAGGTVRFGDDVGAAFELRSLDVEGAVELAQDTSFTALQTIDFRNDVDASADDAAAVTVTAGDAVRLGGDLGAGGRLSGLVVESESIVFDGAGDQQVVTGAGGIGVNPTGLPQPPTLANVGKRGGGLRLESTGGSVLFSANQKLTVDGLAELVGDVVRVGDVNARDIAVSSPDLAILVRPPGTFLVPGVGLVPDQGAEWIADSVSTTSVPVALGSGPPPRIATLSGAVDGAGAGAIAVTPLGRPVASADLVDATDGTLYDLGIPVVDPGDETEPDPRPVDPLLPARPGDDAAAGSAGAPGDEAVLAFLACSRQAEGEREARACAPAPGSPLDSPRGAEIALRHRRLFGPSEAARSARERLRESSAEARAARRDLVALLAQLRLLGMQEEGYERVRDRLLETAAGADGSAALLSALRAESRGFPL